MHPGAEPSRVRDDGSSEKSLNIPTLVRTYKLLSDGDGPRFSVRFVGAIVGVLVIVGALGAAYYFGAPSATTDAPPNHFAATTNENADGTRTDYVGYLPDSFSPTIGFDATRVDAAMREWYIEHPNSVIISKEPKWVGGHIIGYEILFRPSRQSRTRATRVRSRRTAARGRGRGTRAAPRRGAAARPRG
jgi:hypothetical protein